MSCRVVKPVWVPCLQPRLHLVAPLEPAVQPPLVVEPHEPTLDELEDLLSTNPSLYLLLVGRHRVKVAGVWRRPRLRL